jgi:DNA-binding response OmpR family regulator
MFKIFIIEDDKKLSALLSQNLEKWNFITKEVEDFSNIINEFINYDPNLVLLDINLPAFDGFYWCSKIREISKVPVIFISSRNSNMDIIMAINMGGDDFIQKPLSTEILIAKINALLRRTYSYHDTQTNVIEYNGIVLDMKDNILIYKDEKIELTKNEYKILYVLIKNNNKIVLRDDIMRVLWEDESFVDDNTLNVNINRLRKKLEEYGIKDVIKTKKGQGYILS